MADRVYDKGDERGVFSSAWLGELAEDIHAWACVKGFWDDDRGAGECIALMHSELSEALEAERHGNPPDEHCPEYDSVTIELADCIIRILDYAGAHDLDIGGAIMAKMRFNETRPHKHGKEF